MNENENTLNQNGELRTLPAGYLEAAARTAIYSPQWAVIYPALGLGNEVGELYEKVASNLAAEQVLGELGDVLWYIAALARDARVTETQLVWFQNTTDAGGAMFTMVSAAGAAQGHVKKALRDHDGDLEARRHGLLLELSRVLYAADLLAQAYGSTIEAVAQANLDKLADRAERNALQGDGDVR